MKSKDLKTNIMTKEHKLYELSKELVYQMTGNYTEDTQNADFQIAWTYLNKAMDFIQCCEELPTKEDDTEYWVDLVNWESGGIEEVSNTNLIEFKKNIDLEIQRRLKK